MFKKLLKNIADTLSQNRQPLTIEFNDPIAKQTEWTPLKPGGTNFCTRRLMGTHPNLLEFKPTKSAVLFYSLFLVIGLAVMILPPMTNSKEFTNAKLLMPILIGGVFAFVGGLLLYYGTIPIVFDKQKGLYINSLQARKNTIPGQMVEGGTRLSDIHALQILREHVRGNKSSYHSYELNLVLRDGKRVNVIDHGSYPKLLEDAARLAQFLGKPLWDTVK